MSIIAIDGPAGSGKGTIASGLAKRVGFIHLDSGAIYRCVTLEVIKRKIDILDEEAIASIIDDLKIEFRDNDTIYLNNENVTKVIRENDVSNKVADVAKIKRLRDKVEILQRKMSENKDIIMEGRDIGTTVFPNADIKFYLDADIEERARRRYKENLEKGIETSYDEVLETLKNRDYTDMNRKISPLRKAEDAIVIDSTNLTIEEVLDKMEEIVRRKEL